MRTDATHSERVAFRLCRLRPVREEAAAAVDAALGAGASYADARAVVRRAQSVGTRNGRVDTLADAESEGIGVRVLVNGAWGFACDRRLERRGREGRRAPRRRLRRGGRLARTAARSRRSRRARARSAPPMERDPFDVSLEDKVALCLRAEEALKHADVKVAQAGVRALREHKLFLSSEGAEIDQELVECGGGIDVTAVARRDRPGAELPERARRLERAGRLGVRRVARPGRERPAGRRGGGSAPQGGRVPARRDHGRDRRRADAAPGARVGRPPDRARPRLRDRGRLRRHELPQARGSRLAPLRLRAHEHHRRRDHAARPRHLRLRRRGRARRARGSRRRRRPHATSSPRGKRPRRSATAPAARCAPTAGSGCRSSG